MRHWVALGVLGLIWGSSFMLIRIGVEVVHPLHLVMLRVGIAAVCFTALIIITRKRIPRDWKTLGGLTIIGLGNTLIPFLLITWGEQSIESGLASVLQATAALFGLIVAHFAFQDERITAPKAFGFIAGFIGVIILASRSLQGGELQTSSLMGQVAIVVASLFYALFTAYSRKIIKGQVEPVVVAAFAMLFAAITDTLLILSGVIFFELPFSIPADIPVGVLVALLTLGFVHTFIAYLLFYNIIKALGAARATMVTYIVPPVGLFLGVLFLNEALDFRLVLGAGMIFSGIAIANVRLSASGRSMLNLRRLGSLGRNA